MKRLLLYLTIFFSVSQAAFATHQRAGEITFKHISGLTYEVTIITYSYAPSLADRPELEIKWGDGSSTVLQRTNGPPGINPAGIYCDHLGEIVGPDIKRNLYIGQHTYPGAATFKLSLEDPNRNYGILNIPNSVDIPLFIETQLTINPFIGINNSPQLLLPPIDRGCVNQPYIHNPGAYDPDGDSLSFRLTICRYTNGNYIPGYKYPNLVDAAHSSTFSMDPVTGEIKWLNPTLQGEYNIAFLIEEWRDGIKIGYVTRDMQITIVSCQNHPPVIKPMADTCVVAGDTARIKVSATDIDRDRITLTATGTPMLLNPNPAVLSILSQGDGFTTGRLTWPTICSQIKKTPYTVYIKATDNSQPVSLFDLKAVNITVIGPKTKGLTVNAVGNSINLTWRKNNCSNVTGFKIYRRNGFYGFVPGPCETGVPAYTGYSLISTKTSGSDTTFADDNKGKGLSHGVDYCYMVVAVYADGSESKASDEVCSMLKKDLPVITNVTIDKTGTTDGVVRVVWSKPTQIDVVAAPGPYRYLIYRAFNYDGSNAVLIDSLSTLNDTVYTSSNINTKDGPVSFRIDLINLTTGKRFRIGSSEPASSVYILLAPGDNKMRVSFNFAVPWLNTRYVVYRQNKQTLNFDSIGQTTRIYYDDLSVLNGTSYCYKIKSIGSYNTPGIINPLINWSQINCATPVDNEAPCPPVLQVDFDCSLHGNILVWTNPNHFCAKDVAKYYIYYRRSSTNPLAVIDSVLTANDTVYIHKNIPTVIGCYAVLAVDKAGNRSRMSDTACITVDTCGRYRLPNVFSPNDDGFNDYFVPFPFVGVERIDLQVFNRWGKLVFKTSDPDINWDGKIMGTNQPASDGVYYYICDVYEVAGEGTVKRTLKGSITIIR